MAEEDGAVLVVPTPVSPAAYADPNLFATWESQGPAESDKIRAVYASFAAVDEEKIGELLSEITESKEGE